MEQLIYNIINAFDVTYMGTVVFSTWIVLKKIMNNPTSDEKLIISIISGIIFAIIWLYLLNTKLETILLSFFSSIVFYEWIVKRIMRKLNITYEDKSLKIK